MRRRNLTAIHGRKHHEPAIREPQKEPPNIQPSRRRRPNLQRHSTTAHDARHPQRGFTAKIRPEESGRDSGYTGAQIHEGRHELLHRGLLCLSASY